jgi:hypothetical protein
MKTLPCFLITALAIACVPVQAADHSFDVVVYGATPGGVTAAVAASREGATVALVEPTRHIGGVNSGGLSFSDSNQTVRSTLLGLFEEFHLRIETDYQQRGITLPYKVAVKDHAVWTYEPHVAARVIDAMLSEAKVAVFPAHILERADKNGATIARIVVRGGDTFSAKTFVDATYEGDLMAAAGVSWTIGREGRGEFNESLAGRQYPKKAMAISGLDASGAPLPLITTTEVGDPAVGDKRVMVYSFRLCVTREPELRVSFPAPKQYDPARFEVVRRYYQADPKAPFPWDLYPIPGKKFDANNGIWKQFSMGLVGGCNGWSEGSQEVRDRMWEEHKQYTLEQYHFFSTDPAIPEAIRTQMASLGLCKDEFADYGHWSPQLYVREGRRMQGVHVVTQNDILKEPVKDDPIAVSSFPIDSHDVQRIAKPDGTVINEGTIMPLRVPGTREGPAYHIPYRSITPKAGECNNLLVPVALSCTHVGISSIRVEPTWMAIGQSAGIAAALAAKQQVAVQQLAYATLRERLLAQKQVLELPDQPGREKLRTRK